MRVALGFKGLLEDDIPIRMICDHDVLVARAGLDRKAPRVVRVKFAERQDIEKEFVRCKYRSGQVNDWLG